MVEIALENVFNISCLSELLSSNQRQLDPLLRIGQLGSHPVLLFIDPFSLLLIRVLQLHFYLQVLLFFFLLLRLSLDHIVIPLNPEDLPPESRVGCPVSLIEQLHRSVD